MYPRCMRMRYDLQATDTQQRLEALVCSASFVFFPSHPLTLLIARSGCCLRASCLYFFGHSFLFHGGCVCGIKARERSLTWYIRRSTEGHDEGNGLLLLIPASGFVAVLFCFRLSSRKLRQRGAIEATRIVLESNVYSEI